MASFTHLTHEQRVLIEDRLNHNYSFRQIAEELGKTTSTVSREVKKNAIVIMNKNNDCVKFKTCTHKNMCAEKDCIICCSKCGKIDCRKYCSDYSARQCLKKKNNPYVCNGCSQKSQCSYRRMMYKSHEAQKNYIENLKERRQGYDITNEQLAIINDLASPLIKQGCSPYHIKETLGDKLPISEATLRRMINGRVLDARDIDLRDAVKRKERKRTLNKDRLARIKVSKLGHLYSDYLRFTSENETNTVEMDCVEGKKEEDASLLTLHFKEAFVQIAIIMEKQDSVNVIKALDKIETSLGTELFKEMFPIILTDNGQEFTDIEGMERSINGGKRTTIYFCEPNRSDEKGSCENHHKMIRWVIPKGNSLEPFTQADITLMMNHINSYKRKSLYGKSAYEVAKAMFPTDFFILLGLEEISPEKINLTPNLLRRGE